MGDVKKEFLDKEIESILVRVEDKKDTLFKSRNGKIERFEVCGEMAWVPWFRVHTNKGELDINGKYVVAVRYKKDKVK